MEQSNSFNMVTPGNSGRGDRGDRGRDDMATMMSSSPNSVATTHLYQTSNKNPSSSPLPHHHERSQPLQRFVPNVLYMMITSTPRPNWLSIAQRAYTHPMEVHVVDRFSCTILHHVIRQYNPHYSGARPGAGNGAGGGMEGYTNFLKALILILDANPTAITRRNANGDTPLLLACYKSSHVERSLQSLAAAATATTSTSSSSSTSQSQDDNGRMAPPITTSSRTTSFMGNIFKILLRYNPTRSVYMKTTTGSTKFPQEQRKLPLQCLFESYYNDFITQFFGFNDDDDHDHGSNVDNEHENEIYSRYLLPTEQRALRNSINRNNNNNHGNSLKKMDITISDAFQALHDIYNSTHNHHNPGQQQNVVEEFMKWIVSSNILCTGTKRTTTTTTWQQSINHQQLSQQQEDQIQVLLAQSFWHQITLLLSAYRSGSRSYDGGCSGNYHQTSSYPLLSLNYNATVRTSSCSSYNGNNANSKKDMDSSINMMMNQRRQGKILTLTQYNKGIRQESGQQFHPLHEIIHLLQLDSSNNDTSTDYYFDMAEEEEENVDNKEKFKISYLLTLLHIGSLLHYDELYIMEYLSNKTPLLLLLLKKDEKKEHDITTLRNDKDLWNGHCNEKKMNNKEWNGQMSSFYYRSLPSLSFSHDYNNTATNARNRETTIMSPTRGGRNRRSKSQYQNDRAIYQTIKFILKIHPQSATIPLVRRKKKTKDEKQQGQLPLHVLLEGFQQPWRDCSGHGSTTTPVLTVEEQISLVLDMIYAAPKTIHTRDVTSHLYPFMIVTAAPSSSPHNGGDDNDGEGKGAARVLKEHGGDDVRVSKDDEDAGIVSLTYTILRTLPEVIDHCLPIIERRSM